MLVEAIAFKLDRDAVATETATVEIFAVAADRVWFDILIKEQIQLRHFVNSPLAALSAKYSFSLQRRFTWQWDDAHSIMCGLSQG